MSLAVVTLGLVSGIIASLTLAPSAALGGGRAYVLLKNLAYWGVWAALIPAAVTMASGIRRRAWSWPQTVGAHVATAVAFATLHMTALAVIDAGLQLWLLHRILTGPQVVADMAAGARITIEWQLTMYAALAALTYATSLQSEVRQHTVAEAQLERSLAEARLRSLQRQLQPHFLFNTLHAVSALISRDPDMAEAVIERLGRLLRTTLRSDGAAEVSVAEDVAVLQDYLAIEAVQMRERLVVAFELQDETLDAAVPALLLQPLVENSVRHGLQPRARGGSIAVSVKRVDDDLCLEIVDDGLGLTAGSAPGSGVGLANTRSRLAQLYGSRHSFALVPVDTGGVRVSITLPFRRL